MSDVNPTWCLSTNGHSHADDFLTCICRTRICFCVRLVRGGICEGSDQCELCYHPIILCKQTPHSFLFYFTWPNMKTVLEKKNPEHIKSRFKHSSMLCSVQYLPDSFNFRAIYKVCIVAALSFNLREFIQGRSLL